MICTVLPQRIDYDGSQLHHCFAYETAGKLGPTIVAFRGAANVKDHLVDLEDVVANDFISSEDMWHFIIEIPGASITESVLWQRKFVTLIRDYLNGVQSTRTFRQEGDDIKTTHYKLSVSIATLSQFSGLIHTGINVTVGEGCPVKAIGLDTIFSDKDDIDEFGNKMCIRFRDEFVDIMTATYKVRSV